MLWNLHGMSPTSNQNLPLSITHDRANHRSAMDEALSNQTWGMPGGVMIHPLAQNPERGEDAECGKTLVLGGC